MALLEVSELEVAFQTPDATVRAVNGVSFDLEEGSTLGIVGESGSGKSQSVLAMLGLLAGNGRASGRAIYQGENLLTMPRKALNRIRGNSLSMIFQDPMTSLNPYLTVERQMTEVLELHKNMTRRAAKKRAIDMLEAVRIPEAAHRVDQYPHELSGGMRQRVMIAIALACDPKLLIADEPTTALDVTLQAQILDLMRELKAASGAAIILITHDLGVVAEVCDEVAVMYAGEIVERAAVDALFAGPQHPYTVGLLGSIPRLDRRASHLATIEGMVPNMANPPPGCRFAARCPFVGDICISAPPPLAMVSPGHTSRCIKAPLERLVS